MKEIYDHRLYQGSYIKKLFQEMLRTAKRMGYLTELNTIFYAMGIKERLKNEPD